MEEKIIHPKILFSDYFKVDKQFLREYDAFNISLVSDLPLFIDPFLIFNSKKVKYQKLHGEIIKYLIFLRDEAEDKELSPGLIAAWYKFGEIKQNWLGYSLEGNKGHALGPKFAKSLRENFILIFNDFGDEKSISKGVHLEKLCLLEEGVGKDNISDFSTNLIKSYLLEYTQKFAKQYINSELCHSFRVRRVRFNYTTKSWEDGEYFLPEYNGDFVILTPRDMLTREDVWINNKDLINDFRYIPQTIENAELRDQINNYFNSILTKKPTKKEEREAAIKTIRKFPRILEYYIKYKEDNGEIAEKVSEQRVAESEDLYFNMLARFARFLAEKTGFYTKPFNSYSEALERAKYLKHVIEDNDGYKFFYDVKGKPIQREIDLRFLYRLTWYKSPFDFNTEVNNGRGPVDSRVSMGSSDASVVEYKLASSTQLKRNLKNQVPIYQKAGNTNKSIKIIIFFSEEELKRVKKILEELGISTEESIILIDARKDNKVSASKA